MTKETVALLSAVIPAACWAGSLRRTPYSVAWAAYCVAAVAITIATILLPPHVAVGGAEGIAVGFGLLAIIPVVATEFTVAESPGYKIGTYRKERHPLPVEHWTVYVSGGARHTTSNSCEVGVKRGDQRRVVGSADPIEDMDAYADLKVRAEEIANVYNREKVQ